MKQHSLNPIGATLLIAGTCIGSGMIALPMLLSKLGLVYSTLLMLFIWVATYYTSLVTLELQLQSGRGLTIGELGKKFSGPKAGAIGVICLKLLSYALLAAYLYASSDIIQTFTGSKLTLVWCATGAATILLLPIKFIDHINRGLFLLLLVAFLCLLGALISAIHWNRLPLLANEYTTASAWASAIPLVFTSFGFQGSLHTVANHCGMDAKALRRSVLIGTLIPVVIYIVWTLSVMGVLYAQDPLFYEAMAAGTVKVGELVEALMEISQHGSIQLIVQVVSLLAIITSAIGVGAGLVDSLKSVLPARHRRHKHAHITSVLVAVLPASLVAALVPQTFIAALSFAGMILAIIAILLPVYLLSVISAEPRHWHYRLFKARYVLWLFALGGLVIVGCELWNLLYA